MAHNSTHQTSHAHCHCTDDDPKARCLHCAFHPTAPISAVYRADQQTVTLDCTICGIAIFTVSTLLSSGAFGLVSRPSGKPAEPPRVEIRRKRGRPRTRPLPIMPETISSKAVTA